MGSPMPSLHRSIFLACFVVACGDGALSTISPPSENGATEDDADAGGSPAAARDGGGAADAATHDAGRRDATAVDAASATDAAGVPADAAVDAASPSSGFLDETCDLNPPTVSPNGQVIAYDDCQGGLVVRNVVSGAVATVSELGWERAATPGGLVYSNGSNLTTKVVDWSGQTLAAFAYLGDLSRVRQVGTTWKAAARVEDLGDGGFSIFFRTATSAPSLVESAHAPSTGSPSIDSIVSEDGTRAAAIERPTSGSPRLTIAPTSANAAVTTVSLAGFDRPRWIPGSGHATSALFVASRKLYEVNLVTGAIKSLSTGPVIAATTAGLQVPDASFAHVVSRGSLVYWIESGPQSSYTVHAWNRATPAVPTTTIASGADASGAAPVPWVDGYPVQRGIALTGDASRLLVFVEEQVNHAHWKAIDVTSHAETVLEEGGYAPSLGGAARTAIGAPPVFRDLATGESREIPLTTDTVYGFVTPDGALLLSRSTTTVIGSAAVAVERLDFAGGTTTLLSLPSSPEATSLFPASHLVPVHGGLVLRVPASANAPPSSKPKHRLYLAR